jgi:hypothetical protein
MRLFRAVSGEALLAAILFGYVVLVAYELALIETIR